VSEEQVVEEQASTPAEPEGLPPLTDLPDVVQAHIKELRDEAASNRVAAKEYKDSFRNYTDDEKQYMLQLARMTTGSAEDQAKAAAEYVRLANVLGHEGDEIKPDPRPAAKDVEDDGDTVANPGLSDEEVEERINKRIGEFDRKQQMASAVAQVKRDATELGYEVDSTEYDYLLTVARKSTNGDIKAAHAEIESQRQAAIDAFVAEQQTKGVRFPTQSRQSAAPPNDGTPPDWVGDDKKTSAAVAEWLDAQAGDS